MPTVTTTPFTSVYGPVQSWRFGRSLGIDPIGATPTCSFNCVYCQLGEIQHQSCSRQVFIPTQTIQHDLQTFRVCDVNTITLSGSGEPTLAQNLGEILGMAKQITRKQVGVLTNGSLLSDRAVREELALADWVSVKVDAISDGSFRRINHPITTLNLQTLWAGLLQFRQIYSGHLAIQTMLLTDWSGQDQTEYIRRMQALMPDEIQLNTPTRPRPLTHQLEARGNYIPADRPYPTQPLQRVKAEVLEAFGDRITSAIGLPVRYPLLKQDEHHEPSDEPLS
ncbi:radical SAM protein [Phormidesmis priestleyi ULC007]|uniref:Radical SAM protein n=1 Tax=Phormidesmis priestleyi ULC007 TaxID=1920490 RepID=A0A2T1DA18_9CYAN|nr:radical SAM protein [Phormidesmis priestleyi]PSB17271.1 radical SAM protein [Phormidesmis priestleyi ULC007]PZO48060.1 MAG: radical SAM protein [Phormidesmis priestleyi]